MSPESQEMRDIASRVSREVATNDEMYVPTNANHYFSVGQNGLHNILLSLAVANVNKEGVTDILDMPCGHGRVLRWIRGAFPDANITACDVNVDGVDYCAREFGATPIYSKANPAELAFPSKYDIIWVGSLLTHFDKNRWPSFLQFFASSLKPNGVLIFTTHGQHSVRRIEAGIMDYGLKSDQVRSILRWYRSTGFGYKDYPGSHRVDNYGVSLSSMAWVASAIRKSTSLRIVKYTEAGWDFHQDVVACTPHWY